MISVVIACRDDPDLLSTLESLFSTGPEALEVVVVDDASTVPITLPKDDRIRLIRNRHTIGVGASRHVGVLAASSDVILLTDAHMRFCQGWNAGLHLLSGTEAMICGQTLALHESDTHWEQYHGEYWGAKMVVRNPGAELPRYRFLNPEWAPKKEVEGPLREISAIMGALYAFSRNFFLKVGGLRMLRGFGGDEELLSVKWIRAGGKIFFSPHLRAGHKFRPQNRAPYQIPFADLLYNKLMIAHTCTPIGDELSGLLGHGVDIRSGLDVLRANWGLIATERAYLDSIFTLSWEDYEATIKAIDG